MTALPNGRAKLWELWSCDPPRRTEKLAAYSLEELAINRELESADFRWFAHLRPMVAARITTKLHDANPQPDRTGIAADGSKRLDRGDVAIPIWALVAGLSLLLALGIHVHQ